MQLDSQPVFICFVEVSAIPISYSRSFTGITKIEVSVEVLSLCCSLIVDELVIIEGNRSRFVANKVIVARSPIL